MGGWVGGGGEKRRAVGALPTHGCKRGYRGPDFLRNLQLVNNVCQLTFSFPAVDRHDTPNARGRGDLLFVCSIIRSRAHVEMG